jgi:hypothetical protein
MFQNEADFLAEWLDYHLFLGFDHIFLTNDNSGDHYAEVLAPYQQAGLVSLETARSDIDFYEKEQWHKNQILKGPGKAFEWVAFLDTDEFLYWPEGDLSRWLQRFRKTAGLVLSWYMYGSSEVKRLKPQELLLEKLYRRFPDFHEENEAVKSLVRPDAGVLFFNKNPHYPQYSPWRGLHWVDGQRFRPKQKRKLRKPLSLNHYWYRTDQFFEQVKRPRRQFFEQAKRSELLERWHYERSNAVADPFPPERLAAFKHWREERNF